MISNILLVALGGGLGSIARYLCQRWVAGMHTTAFPWGTFSVNIAGCLLIGIFWGLSLRAAQEGGGFHNGWQLFLMTGLCGGFTTFSAFTLEGIVLLKEQRTGIFFLYMGASMLTGLLATYAGIKLIRV
jgi:fluoride exporter